MVHTVKYFPINTYIESQGEYNWDRRPSSTLGKLAGAQELCIWFFAGLIVRSV